MTYTKDEAASLIRAKQDIDLFLRLADARLNTMPEYAPFPTKHGHAVIIWLRSLAVRYGQGVDISTIA